MTDINPFYSPHADIPLLRKAVEWVEAQEALPAETRTWHQDRWVVPEAVRVEFLDHEPGCGTSYCLAGYVAAQKYPELADSPYASIDGEARRTPDVAAELLGLTGDGDMTYHPLFEGSNTAQDIRRIAEAVAGERL